MKSSIRLWVAELPAIPVIIVCAIRRLRVTVVLSAPFTVAISESIASVGVTPISINVTAHNRLQFRFRANRPTSASTQTAGMRGGFSGAHRPPLVMLDVMPLMPPLPHPTKNQRHEYRSDGQRPFSTKCRFHQIRLHPKIGGCNNYNRALPQFLCFWQP